MPKLSNDTPYVGRVVQQSSLDQIVFKLDLARHSLKMWNYDGHIEIKQADIAALLDLLAPFDYPLGKQTYFTYFPIPITRLTIVELVQAAQRASEEMVALDVCICDKKYGNSWELGERKAEALYFKESHQFGICCHDYGYTRWCRDLALEASMQYFMERPWLLKEPH